MDTLFLAEAQNIVLVVGVLTSSTLAVIGAVFSGIIAIKQLPQQSKKIEAQGEALAVVTATVDDPTTGVKAIHTLTNTNFSKQTAKIEELESQLRLLNADSIEDARTRADAANGKAPESASASRPATVAEVSEVIKLARELAASDTAKREAALKVAEDLKTADAKREG